MTNFVLVSSISNFLLFILKLGKVCSGWECNPWIAEHSLQFMTSETFLFSCPRTFNYKFQLLRYTLHFYQTRVHCLFPEPRETGPEENSLRFIMAEDCLPVLVFYKNNCIVYGTTDWLLCAASSLIVHSRLMNLYCLVSPFCLANGRNENIFDGWSCSNKLPHCRKSCNQKLTWAANVMWWWIGEGCIFDLQQTFVWFEFK